MNCPLCHQKLHAIGSNGFDDPIGYTCPTKIAMTTGPINGKDMRYWEDAFKVTVSHYEIRGARTIINLPEDYRIITWNDPLESYGHSTIMHFVPDYGYRDVFSCQEMPIESEEKLLTRIKTLALFS